MFNPRQAQDQAELHGHTQSQIHLAGLPINPSSWRTTMDQSLFYVLPKTSTRPSTSHSMDTHTAKPIWLVFQYTQAPEGQQWIISTAGAAMNPPTPHGVLGDLLLWVFLAENFSLRAENPARSNSLDSWVPQRCCHHTPEVKPPLPTPADLGAASSWPWLLPGGSRTPRRQSPCFWFYRPRWGRRWRPRRRPWPSSSLPGSPPSSWFWGCPPRTGGSCPRWHTRPGVSRSWNEGDAWSGARSQERGRLKQSPSAVLKHEALVSAVLWDIPVALLSAKAATAKCDIRQHSWNEGFEGEITAKFCFSYLRFSLLLPPGNCTPPTQVLVLSPVACGFPLPLWLRFWGKKIPCHGEAPFEDSPMRTHQWANFCADPKIKTSWFASLGSKYLLQAWRSAKLL